MALGNFDPTKLVTLIEGRLPQWLGRPLINFTIICVLAGLSASGLTLVSLLIQGTVWPFLSTVFGGTDGALTLDSIETVMFVLTFTVVVLLGFMSLGIYVAYRTVRRRNVPQQVIDQLAEYRSEVIRIYNKKPTEEIVKAINDLDEDDDEYFQQREEIGKPFAEEVKASWQEWMNIVTEYLEQNMTKAEALSFNRMGLVPGQTFRHAVTTEHAQVLNMIAKQMVTLEDIIQRYQERR